MKSYVIGSIELDSMPIRRGTITFHASDHTLRCDGEPIGCAPSTKDKRSAVIDILALYGERGAKSPVWKLKLSRSAAQIARRVS